MAGKIVIRFEDTLALPAIMLATPDGKRPLSARASRAPLPIDIAEFFRGAPVASAAMVSLTAGALVPGHRAIMLDGDGNGVPAAPTYPWYNFAGVSVTGANAGGSFDAQISGIIEEATWNFTPMGVVYVGAYGVLTQTVPTAGVVHAIGTAKTPHQILISPQTPIILG